MSEDQKENPTEEPPKDVTDDTSAAGEATAAGDVDNSGGDGEKEEGEAERIRGGGKVSRDSGRQGRKHSPYASAAGGGAGGGGGNDDGKNRRVYVGNLSWGVSWQDLKDHMREVGEVTRADIMTGSDGRSKGCGIVEYQNEEDAKKAVLTLNDTELNGRQIFVREDREERGSSSGSGAGGAGGDGKRFSSDEQAQSRRVYVGNLSWDVAWQDLKDHMREAGEVVHAEVITEANGRSKGCGLVEYATSDEAQEAITLLTDTELKGRMIFVREDRENSSSSYHAGSGRGGGGSTSVYIWNLSFETSWQDLKDHCRAAGNVDNASILTGQDGRSIGCGVVVYQTAREAARAIRELQNSELNGRQIHLREDRVQSAGGGGGRGGGGRFGRGGRRGGRGDRGGDRGGGGGGSGGGGGGGSQLFVGNLSYQTSWQELKDHFRQCGDVVHAEVMEAPDGRKKGFGTVRFSNASDAEKAIKELNGVELDGRDLEVRFDQKAGF